MKYLLLIILFLCFSSCGSTNDTTEGQYSQPTQESFRNSPFDTNGGIRNTSSFRNDSERHNRPEYWNSPTPRKYNYWNVKRKDTISNTSKKKKGQQ